MLPDAMAVYPGHVAGSLCGIHMSEAHSSSIGLEKQTNHALHSNLHEFVEESASLTTPKPPTTERVVALNRGPWVGARPALTELDAPDETLVLDVRPIDVFAAGHRPGAISVALDGGSFATRSCIRARSGRADHRACAIGSRCGRGIAVAHGGRALRAARLRPRRRDGDDAHASRQRELELLDHDEQVLDVREPGEGPESRLAEDPLPAPARRAAGRARSLAARLLDLRKRCARDACHEPARTPRLRRARGGRLSRTTIAGARRGSRSPRARRSRLGSAARCG